MNWKRVTSGQSADAVAPPGTRHRSRLWRISLSGMLVLLTVLAIGTGWLSMKGAQAHRQRAVVEALGATDFDYDFQRPFDNPGLSISRNDSPSPKPPGPAIIRWLFGEHVFANIVALNLNTDACEDLNPALLEELVALDTLEYLSLHDQPVGDSDLKCLRSLPNLRGLNLSGTSISDDALRNLSGMRQLTDLNISNTKISGVGLVHLRNCSQLESLSVSNVAFTPEGAGAIANLVMLQALNAYLLEPPKTPVVGDEILEACAKLEHLTNIDVDERPVTDAGFRHLRNLPQLQVLDAEGTKITDEGLAHIAAQSSLIYLRISFNNVTDAGLAHLRHLIGLEELQLRHTRVTDDGVRQLQGLKRLKCLDLRETLITDQSLQVLKDLPSLSLDWCDTWGTAVTAEGRAQIAAELSKLKLR